MAQTFYPITPVEVTPGTASAWTDVDVSALGVPAGATGVILHLTMTSTGKGFGLRKNGSTDDRHGDIYGGHFGAAIGVDANRVFEAFLGDITNIDLYLIGYTTSGVTFFTNAYSKTLPRTLTNLTGVATGSPKVLYTGSNTITVTTLGTFTIVLPGGYTGTATSGATCKVTGSPVALVGGSQVIETTGGTGTFNITTVVGWSDIDCSVEAPSAIGLIFDYTTNDTGLRKNGSTDNRKPSSYGHTFVVIGCDASQIVECYTMASPYFLIGYITDGCTFNTNATDVSLGTTGNWLDLAALPATSVMGFIEIVESSLYAYGLRKNGSAEDIYLAAVEGMLHLWAFVECDANGIIEGKIANTAVDFFVVGYATSEAVNITITLAATADATGASVSPLGIISADVPSAMLASGAVLSPTATIQAIIESLMTASGNELSPIIVIQATPTSVMMATGDFVLPAVIILAVVPSAMAATGSIPTPSSTIQADIPSVMIATTAGVVPTILIQATLTSVMTATGDFNSPLFIVRADVASAMLATGDFIEPTLTIVSYLGILKLRDGFKIVQRRRTVL